MTPREEARKCARLLNAWANKKTLQRCEVGRWRDWDSEKIPCIEDSLNWRVKPEPRTLWSAAESYTHDERVAKMWESKGLIVDEYREVVK